ncbi:DUF3099 domain-containing protein [Streptacidiphilus melanogenes]|uniref:DUF3099 domain-containing protein n=1 Tax=Streptacidiphilus melanogenes TaxID=411235 RepID=UPI0005A95863|nr:DUF3099 domain-containing protein [Streptacidiphilus melanogenes]
MHFHSHTNGAVRITAARPGLSEDIRHRQRRYALTMGIRTLCVILAIVLWQVDRVAAVIAIVAGGVLPYIAVVFANAGHENADEPFDSRYTPEPPVQQGLPHGPGPSVPPPRGESADWRRGPRRDDGPGDET